MPLMPLTFPESTGRPKAAADTQIAQCVAFLLRAMVETDADVAFLASGQKPYVIGPRGTRPLWAAELSANAMRRFLTHLLPEASRDLLAVTGAAQYELPSAAGLPSEHFTIDAEFSNGASVMAVRRSRVAAEDYAPINLPTPRPLRHDAAIEDDTLTVPTSAELWGPSSAAAIAHARRRWL